jgi:hypothetical protein
MKKILLSAVFAFIFLLCGNSRLYGSDTALGSLPDNTNTAVNLQKEKGEAEQKAEQKTVTLLDSLDKQLFKEIAENVNKEVNKTIKGLSYSLYAISILLFALLVIIVVKLMRSQDAGDTDKIISKLEELRQALLSNKPDASNKTFDNEKVLISIENINTLLSLILKAINKLQPEKPDAQPGVSTVSVEISRNNENEDKQHKTVNKLYVENTNDNGIFLRPKESPDENTLYELAINKNGDEASFVIYDNPTLKQIITNYKGDNISKECETESETGRYTNYRIAREGSAILNESGLWELKDMAKIIFF